MFDLLKAVARVEGMAGAGTEWSSVSPGDRPSSPGAVPKDTRSATTAREQPELAVSQAGCAERFTSECDSAAPALARPAWRPGCWQGLMGEAPPSGSRPQFVHSFIPTGWLWLACFFNDLFRVFYLRGDVICKQVVFLLPFQFRCRIVLAGVGL